MRKLTESDKQEILKLYRESAETTSTLAERYDVSNSTISRLLKSTLAEDEYEYLVSLKRAARTPEGRAQVSYDNLPDFNQPEVKPEVPAVAKPSVRKQEEPAPQEQPPISSPLDDDDDDDDESTPVIRRVKRRSSAEKPLPKPVVASVEKPLPKPVVAEQLELLEQKPHVITNIKSPLIEDSHPEVNAIAQMFGEDLLDESEELEDLDDEEDDDDYEDDEDYQAPRLVTRSRGDALVRVLPLSAANLPKTCYLVIDRSSELITRPLRDFGDLGQIPNLETQQKTLPIFDNHRVAKRFSTKRDRVIKVPDSKMLHKARYHLQAKGITRLLIDGQVYSLSATTV
ncbi:transposase [Iningainema tapete]|uniref:Transposase n=1 Tax=Iningainema tapete BLCC-T55 TaxID=2748662 RepID=A0A8J6XLP0_9CYAN|nr:transposase [Iningainema tapete BLCC-T55]